MKRIVIAALAASSLLALSANAEARTHLHYRHGHHLTHHHFGRYLAARHFRHHHRHHYVQHYRRHRDAVHVGGGDKPSCFWEARRQGGPCGCWAAWNLLGRVEHVWHGVNLWLANDWLKFPRSEPAPGTAAVWPHRHVAPVVAVNHDGTVTVKDSWKTHKVRTAGLIFVQPPAVGVRLRQPLIKWMSGTPL
jgi:Ni/Co efflux regulator RcnB